MQFKTVGGLGHQSSEGQHRVGLPLTDQLIKAMTGVCSTLCHCCVSELSVAKGHLLDRSGYLRVLLGQIQSQES